MCFQEKRRYEKWKYISVLAFVIFYCHPGEVTKYCSTVTYDQILIDQELNIFYFDIFDHRLDSPHFPPETSCKVRTLGDTQKCTLVFFRSWVKSFVFLSMSHLLISIVNVFHSKYVLLIQKKNVFGYYKLSKDQILNEVHSTSR